MKHEKEILEREQRQRKEEEKRQRIEQLKKEYANFEEEMLTGQVLKELRTCWEVSQPLLFSTSVELESDNVCLCMCLSVCHKDFEAAA